MRTLYPAQAFSPQALLAEIFNSSDTTLTVNDGDLLPAPPNLLTLGTYGEATQETILYTVKSGNVISGITRAVEGTATSWDAGTPVARYYTAKDYDDLRYNVDEIAKTADRTVAFTAATTRANVATGETLATLWGKVAKWFTDLKAVAFSGAYTDLSGAPTSMTPTTHASTHATGQGDAIAPADIGAATSGHTHSGVYAPATHASQHASGGGDAVTPADIGAAASGHTHTGTYAPATHASQHATGQADAITPANIGAAAASHNHSGTYAPATHASQHASGGADAVTPAAIGAIATTAKGAASGVASLDADTKVTAAQASAAIVEVTASLTLGSTHYGRMLRCTNSTAITLTMPKDIPVGTEIEIYRAGAGTVTLSAASGVTVECKESTYGIADKYTSVVLKWVAANTVAIQGNVG
jgi:hypothetical protein